MTVSVWMDQEQLRGRPALSASSALSDLLQEEKDSFGWIVSMLECVCLTFSVLKLEKKNYQKKTEKRHNGLEHLSDTASAENFFSQCFLLMMCLSLAEFISASFCQLHFSEETH